MKTNTEIKDDNQAAKPTVSGHVESVVSADLELAVNIILNTKKNG